MDVHRYAAPSSFGALLRAMGWLTSVAAVVVLGFIINRWPSNGSHVAAGLVGSGIAIFTDSWQMFAIADRFVNFPPLLPSRLFLHDFISLMICIGGLLLILYEGVEVKAFEEGLTLSEALKDGLDEDEYSETAMLRKSLWFLIAVCAWRVFFSLVSSYKVVSMWRRRAIRRRMLANFRRSMSEAPPAV